MEGRQNGPREKRMKLPPLRSELSTMGDPTCMQATQIQTDRVSYYNKQLEGFRGDMCLQWGWSRGQVRESIETITILMSLEI